jgi:DNA-binding NarL/FixJ family response regulator
VLVMTKFEQDDESRMAMQYRADGYLIKAEITPKKLLAIIDNLSNAQPIDA